MLMSIENDQMLHILESLTALFLYIVCQDMRKLKVIKEGG